jgi:membrane associated rhomboid family serine protease
MRFSYNAPFTLTFALICTAIRGLAYIIPMTRPDLIQYAFSVYTEMDFTSLISYFRLFSHALGHSSWEHLFGNLSFILVLAPLLEEKYGSRNLMMMSFITALVTGILEVILFTNEGLTGASGIVFMLILLSSFTNMRKKVIPITFILVLVMYIGKEVINAMQTNQVSEFAHIIGGICGSVFGFFTFKDETPKIQSTSTNIRI